MPTKISKTVYMYLLFISIQYESFHNNWTQLVLFSTYAEPDFVAEDLAAREDVEIPELGLLPYLEMELEQDALVDGESLEVDAEERFSPGVQHVWVDVYLNQIHVRYTGPSECNRNVC